MPLSAAGSGITIDPRDRKIMLGAGVLLLLLIGLALLVPNDQPPETEIPSSYSASSGGAKAAYMLLEQQGYNVNRWTDEPKNLPGDPLGVTLVLAIPTDQPSEAERDALDNFVKKGGHVLAVGAPSWGMFKNVKFAPGPLLIARAQFQARLPGRMARAAPEVTMSAGRTMSPQAGQISLYGDDRGDVVVRCLYGKGEIIWWAGATPLTNAGLRDAGSVELLLNSIGPPGTRVLWDEYFHGLQHGVGHLLAQTPLPWALLQCAILLLAAMITFSRRSGPIHEPVEPSRLSPLEYAETLGGLYRRAKATDVAVQVALDRFRMLAARKLGMRPSMNFEELYSALRTRFRFEDDEFIRVLRECEAAAANPKLEKAAALRLTQALQQYSARLKLALVTRDATRDAPGEKS